MSMAISMAMAMAMSMAMASVETAVPGGKLEAKPAKPIPQWLH